MKICVQTGDVIDWLGFENGYSLFKKVGVEAIDWNIDHAWNAENFRNGSYKKKCIFEKSLERVYKYYQDELNIIKKYGLDISQAHAPFTNILKEEECFLDYAIEVYKMAIQLCDKVGCKNLVIHGLGYSMNDTDLTIKDIDRMNDKMYSSLIPILVNTNVTVCLENLFTSFGGQRYGAHCSTPYKANCEIESLNERAGKECFGFCFDTGHSNLLKQDPRVVIPEYGSRIKCFHIHDNDGNEDLHLAPGTGTINWNYFCESVKSIGYKGDLSFETFNQLRKAMRIDYNLAEPWLNTIVKTGHCFKEKILDESKGE